MKRKLMGILVLASVVIAAPVNAQAPATPAPAPSTEATPAPAPTPTPEQPAAAAAVGTLGERVLGKDDAKVTVIEYASLTCPACAQFHLTTLPAFKTKWVDSGKVKYIYRDFARNQLDVFAAAMIRCATPERQFAFYDILFKNQSQWISQDKEKVETALIRYGRLGGLSEDQIRACWSDKALVERVMKDRLDAQSQFDIKATPTVVINGKSHEGALSVDELDRLLDAASR